MKNNFTKLILAAFSTMLFISLSSCNENKEYPWNKQYSGTLIVLQKDAYSNKPGRNSLLWPPHTTVVLKWDEGESVQLNHGTAPDETDVNGVLLLDTVKVYTFTGTHDELQKLQKEFSNAVYDDANNKFISFEEVKLELPRAILAGISNAILADDKLTCSGSTTKEEIVAKLTSGDKDKIGKAIVELSKCNGNGEKMNEVFDRILKESFDKLGKDLLMYHVCNDDASLQVDLIKHFISKHEIKMPAKVNDGPMVYFFPS